MSFRITGLDPASFRDLHRLSDSDLAAQNIHRVRVDEKPGAPCRISLTDAEVGEQVLLLSYEHLPTHSPYHQQGPIFVRETDARFDDVGVIPPALAMRLLSVRGFDAEGMMLAADVVEGAQAASVIERFFADPDVTFIHAHNAKRGCFAAAITRA